MSMWEASRSESCFGVGCGGVARGCDLKWVQLAVCSVQCTK